MELDELKDLIALLKDTDVTELELKRDGVKVRIKRGHVYKTERVVDEVELGEGEAAAARKAAPDADSLRRVTVTAPLVGTFYRASSPDAEPFVEAGSRVKKGQVICIIEAMKLMNEIESEVDGTLLRALVQNGQAVEYGEPLFTIEPD